MWPCTNDGHATYLRRGSWEKCGHVKWTASSCPSSAVPRSRSPSPPRALREVPGENEVTDPEDEQEEEVEVDKEGDEPKV